jgi:hypothetical protein
VCRDAGAVILAQILPSEVRRGTAFPGPEKTKNKKPKK